MFAIPKSLFSSSITRYDHTLTSTVYELYYRNLSSVENWINNILHISTVKMDQVSIQ